MSRNTLLVIGLVAISAYLLFSGKLNSLASANGATGTLGTAGAPLGSAALNNTLTGLGNAVNLLAKALGGNSGGGGSKAGAPTAGSIPSPQTNSSTTSPFWQNISGGVAGLETSIQQELTTTPQQQNLADIAQAQGAQAPTLDTPVSGEMPVTSFLTAIGIDNSVPNLPPPDPTQNTSADTTAVTDPNSLNSSLDGDGVTDQTGTVDDQYAYVDDGYGGGGDFSD